MTDEVAARPASREQSTKKESTSPPAKSWFRLPDPVRRVFDKFPLVTYKANALPQRTTRKRSSHVLYLFQRPGSVDQSSCNPSCLKYQAYLRFRNIQCRSQPANNHASPTGALPFILPSTDRPSSPVPANKITRWVESQAEQEDKIHIKEDAYISLIDHTIRNAWLYTLYLDQPNFRSVAWPLYVESSSSNVFVRQAIASQLETAAREELLKTMTIISSGEIYQRAADAFKALSTLLAEDQYFFGAAKPGLFDASLFAYTHLLLDEELGWQTTIMKDALAEYDNLIEHRNRLLQQYFSP